MADEYAASIPNVPAPPPQAARPQWSVMIPAYNCANYLRQTLRSVLAQDPGRGRMQIEVVDDCSTEDDPEAVVRQMPPGRVEFYRQPRNVGVSRNFNTCVLRSRGDLVHILHGDDLVQPGFYAAIGDCALRFPQAAILMTRSWYIDEAGTAFQSSPFVKRYAECARDASPLYYGNPLRTPAVVIRRVFYQRYGGFCERLLHVADWEMWARAAAKGGAVMSNSRLACYREFGGNDTSRLRRTAENLRDVLRLADVFSRNYPDFQPDRFHRWVRSVAAEQVRMFRRMGDQEAVAANSSLCRDLGPIKLPLHWRLREFVKSVPVFWDAAAALKRRLCVALHQRRSSET
jgi:glycosyltransferase involved in cell wall biosynthesis